MSKQREQTMKPGISMSQFLFLVVILLTNMANPSDFGDLLYTLLVALEYCTDLANLRSLCSSFPPPDTLCTSHFQVMANITLPLQTLQSLKNSMFTLKYLVQL